MRYSLYFLFVLLIYSTDLKAQDDEISRLFPGKWKMEIENAEVFEEWELLDENVLIGKNYTFGNGVNVLNESLFLQKIYNCWIYIAAPKVEEITLFPLVEYTPKKFIFENKKHDFPQRIVYEFHKDGKMTAAIEGNVNGETKRSEFSFTIIKD